MWLRESRWRIAVWRRLGRAGRAAGAATRPARRRILGRGPRGAACAVAGVARRVLRFLQPPVGHLWTCFARLVEQIRPWQLLLGLLVKVGFIET
jgi:hypothetical protein